MREGLRLIEHREREEAAKLQALREAANRGWADVSAGRSTDLADDELDDRCRDPRPLRRPDPAR